MSPDDLTHEAVLEELRGRLPDGALSTDPDLLAGQQVDLTGRFAGRAAALARPRAPRRDGRYRARTCDPFGVNEVLSQLS